MSRQKFEKTFNTFTKGLMTEASELNFPEDFSLYEKNFLLHRDGGRDRRRGMELVYPLGLTLTSRPYPIEFIDESRTGIIARGIRSNRQPVLKDESETSLSLTKITKTRAVFYTTYADTPEESETSLVLTKITKTREVFYRTYTCIPDESETSLVLTEITKTRVTRHLDYTVPPDESETSLALTKITKTRVTL